MKYMGSKSRITKHIVPIIQGYIDDNEIKQYIEPFVGGANVIDKIRCDKKYGFDENKYLIALLNRVKQELSLYEEVSKDLYDKARTAFNSNNIGDFEEWQIGNIGFIASYNGRWFDGGYAKSGYENTKNGLRFRNYYQEAKRNLESQAPNLKDTLFYQSDYRELENVCDLNNSLVYCDPPYQGTKQYNNAKFFDYDEFWSTMRMWSKDNIVLISELEAPDDFECIWEQEVSRSIKANDKTIAIERLFKLKNLNLNEEGE